MVFGLYQCRCSIILTSRNLTWPVERTYMNLRKLILVIFTLFSFSVIAAEEINVNYSYGANHTTDFSSLRVSLGIGAVTDDRGDNNPNLIAEGYTAEAPLTDIVRNSLIQGFEHGGAELADSGADMQLVGRIVSSQLDTVDRSGVETLQLTIRTNIALQGRGRTIWETTLFGRGTAPVEDGMVAAVHAALDRMIRELVNDDYFLIEIQ